MYVYFSDYVFTPYCYKQLVVKCDYVLKQVQTLSLLKFT